MDDLPNAKVEFLKEISALHQRIEELEASEARHAREKKELSLVLRKLRFLVDACPDLFFLKDMDLRYQLVNSADAEFIGRDEADILGRTDIELMAPETAAACQESDGRAIHERRTVVTAEPVGERFYETKRFPVVLEGEIVGVSGVIRDVTKRKRAEEALRESEEWYRTVFENTGAATVIIEDDTTISLCNTEFEHLSGYPRDEIEGKKSWTEFVIGDDLNRMKVVHEMLRDNGRRNVRGYEFWFLRRTGEMRKIRLAVDKIDGTRKSVSSLTDITDRDRIAEMLRWKTALLEAQVNSSIDGMLVVDANNKKIVTNHRLTDLLRIPQRLISVISRKRLLVLTTRRSAISSRRTGSCPKRFPGLSETIMEGRGAMASFISSV